MSAKQRKTTGSALLHGRLRLPALTIGVGVALLAGAALGSPLYGAMAGSDSVSEVDPAPIATADSSTSARVELTPAEADQARAILAADPTLRELLGMQSWRVAELMLYASYTPAFSPIGAVAVVAWDSPISVDTMWPVPSTGADAKPNLSQLTLRRVTADNVTQILVYVAFEQQRVVKILPHFGATNVTIEVAETPPSLTE